MKRNKYFSALINKYYPWYYTLVTKHKNEPVHQLSIIAIAVFLCDQGLIGEAHSKQVREDVNWLRANRATLTKKEYYYYLQMEHRVISIYGPNMDLGLEPF